jgi:hypothetical protein
MGKILIQRNLEARQEIQERMKEAGVLKEVSRVLSTLGPRTVEEYQQVLPVVLDMVSKHKAAGFTKDIVKAAQDGAVLAKRIA